MQLQQFLDLLSLLLLSCCLVGEAVPASVSVSVLSLVQPVQSLHELGVEAHVLTPESLHLPS